MAWVTHAVLSGMALQEVMGGALRSRKPLLNGTYLIDCEPDIHGDVDRLRCCVLDLNHGCGNKDLTSCDRRGHLSIAAARQTVADASNASQQAQREATGATATPGQ